MPELRTARRIADIGSGAGFPGLPLAAALPDAQVDLIESSGRKADVAERLAAAAGIQNARSIHTRVEEWDGRDYDAATARALAPLAVLVEYAAPLLRVGGVLIAWKGARDPAEEKAGGTAVRQLGMDDARVIPVQPFEGSRDRHLHVFTKLEPTPDRFPRRPGMARKRPLAR